MSSIPAPPYNSRFSGRVVPSRPGGNIKAPRRQRSDVPTRWKSSYPISDVGGRAGGQAQRPKSAAAGGRPSRGQSSGAGLTQRAKDKTRRPVSAANIRRRLKKERKKRHRQQHPALELSKDVVSSVSGPYTRSDPRIFGASEVLPASVAFSAPVPKGVQESIPEVKETTFKPPQQATKLVGHRAAEAFGAHLKTIADALPAAPEALGRVDPNIQKAILWPDRKRSAGTGPAGSTRTNTDIDASGRQRRMSRSEFVSRLGRAARLGDRAATSPCWRKRVRSSGSTSAPWTEAQLSTTRQRAGR